MEVISVRQANRLAVCALRPVETRDDWVVGSCGGTRQTRPITLSCGHRPVWLSTARLRGHIRSENPFNCACIAFWMVFAADLGEVFACPWRAFCLSTGGMRRAGCRWRCMVILDSVVESIVCIRGGEIF